jgi:hypothetical protein
MTYDKWKTTNLEEELLEMPVSEDNHHDELQLVYCALHRALETKCLLIQALQEIKAGLENTETTPGQWLTRCRKRDAWRVARDALIAAGVKS